MLRFIHGDDLPRYPVLRRTMFEDRASQFRDRLGWDVRVDADGLETDQYDALNPIYVIWEDQAGRHAGSMRFLPTLGQTMVNDHFAHLLPEGRLADPLIWECTRFCLATAAAPQVSAALMLGGAELGACLGLIQAVGVFDARMVRVYRMLGWEPEIIGTDGNGRQAIGCGLWDFSNAVRLSMAAKAGISAELSRHWFIRSLGHMRIAA